MLIPEAFPDPEAIRHNAAEILRGSEYHLNQDGQVGKTVVDFLGKIIEWILLPLKWLFESMDGLPMAIQWLVVIGLVVILVLITGHIIYSFVSAFRSPRRDSAFVSTSDSGRTPGPREFEQLAQGAFVQRDYIAAVRFLFRASLAHLQVIEGRSFSPGLTNRQYLRRFGKSPVASALLPFVEIIDANWYGNGVCREEDFLKCRRAYTKIRKQTKGGTDADSA